MIIHHKMLKEHEFRWLLAIQSKLVEEFLRNKVLFIRPVPINSPDGERILRFLRSQVSGLLYCEFKVAQPAGINANFTKQEEIKFFDKIYFENREEMEKFEMNFSVIGTADNVISMFDLD